MNKKIKMAFLISAFLLLSGNIAISYAESPREIRKEIKEVREDEKDDQKGLSGLLSNLKNSIKNKSAKIIDGKAASISGTTLSVTKDGKTYAVDTDSSTKFIRHFWGKSSISDISVGDNLNVWGTWTDASDTTIKARLIRDLSIMKRFGTFFGSITSVASDHFTIQTLQRGSQDVYFTNSTKFVNRKEETIVSGDIKSGDRIRVKGLWDKNLNKITDVTQIKDFSLPAK